MWSSFIPVGNSKYPMEKLFILWGKYFSVGIYFFKVNILHYRWNTLITKVVIYSLSSGLSYCIFDFLYIYSLNECKNTTGIVIQLGILICVFKTLEEMRAKWYQFLYEYLFQFSNIVGIHYFIVEKKLFML